MSIQLFTKPLLTGWMWVKKTLGKHFKCPACIIPSDACWHLTCLHPPPPQTLLVPPVSLQTLTLWISVPDIRHIHRLQINLSNLITLHQKVWNSCTEAKISLLEPRLAGIAVEAEAVAKRNKDARGVQMCRHESQSHWAYCDGGLHLIHTTTRLQAAATGGPTSSCEQAGCLKGEQRSGLVLGTLGCCMLPTETAADGGSTAGVARQFAGRQRAELTATVLQHPQAERSSTHMVGTIIVSSQQLFFYPFHGHYY